MIRNERGKKEGREEKRTQVTNIRNERGNITIGSTNIKRAIREYCEQLYAKKFDYWNKMKIP